MPPKSQSQSPQKKVHHEADVAAPPSAVYDLIADARRRIEWMPEFEQTDAPERHLQAGDHFEAMSSILLHEFLGRSEVLHAVEGSALEEVVVIGARMRTRWELHEQPDGTTRVVHELVVDFPRGPFSRLERWVLGRRLARMQRQAMTRLGEKAAATR